MVAPGRRWRRAGSRHLVVTHQKIHVDLHQPIAEWKQVWDHLERDLGGNAYAIVHGQLVDGRFVTLVQAETGLSVIGPTTLRAKYFLLGPFVVDDPQVRHAQVALDRPDSWIDSNRFYNDNALPVLQVEVRTERLVEMPVGDGVTVTLASSMFGDADVRGVDLIRRSHFKVDLDKPCERARVRPRATSAGPPHLMLGRPVRVTDIRITRRIRSLPMSRSSACTRSTKPPKRPT
jgi:hypothetical protein